MDCRRGFLLCLGMLIPLSGCVLEVRKDTEDRVSRSEKPDEHAPKKPETYIAYADFRAAAAFAPETSPENQQAYCEEARASYLQALAINPKHVPAYLSLARLQQGCHDMPAALVTYQKALQVTLKDPMIWHELGMCQARQKLFGEAVTSFQKACELNPENKTYQTTLAYALARASRWTESLTAMTALIGEAKAHYELARMLYQMEQTDMARQYVTAALSRDPNLAGARDLVVTLGGTPPETTQKVGFTPAPAGQTSPERSAVVEVEPAGEGMRVPPRPVFSIRSAPN